MDFGWAERESAVLKNVQDICREKVRPLARLISRGDKDALRQGMQVLNSIKFMSIPFPPDDGGLGLPFTVWAKAGELVSYESATIGMTAGASMLAAYAIGLHGSAPLKERFLKDLLTGRCVGAFSLTEPGAGSDASAIVVSASRNQNGYCLNGQKAFVTNAGFADTYVVLVKTQPERGVRGMSVLVIPADTPGFVIGEQGRKMAFPALSNAKVAFHNCAVPADFVVGRDGLGFPIAMETLDLGRITVAAGAVGVARAALDAALAHARRRNQFHESIGSFELIQEKIARMTTAIETAELLYLRAAWLRDQGRPFGDAAAMAKLYASRVVKEVTDDALQIFGGYGYSADCPVEQYYREARLFELVEGTSEIQTLIIAKSALRHST